MSKPCEPNCKSGHAYTICSNKVTLEERAKEITDDFSFWGPPITPMQTTRLECTDRIIALLLQVQAEAYEEAAKIALNEWQTADNCRPEYRSNSISHGCIESAKAIRAHAKVMGK
jgi:hypothetical protein